MLLFVFQENYGQDRSLGSFGEEIHGLSEMLQLPSFTLANLMMMYEQGHKAFVDDEILNYRYISFKYWKGIQDVKT